MRGRQVQPGGDAPRRRDAVEGRLGRLVLGMATLGAIAVVAMPAVGQARTDWRYQLAGLADPFLGRPAPGWTLALLAGSTLLYAIVAAVILWSAGRAGTVRPSWARWWCLVPMPAWGGYLLGTLITIAGGGPVDLSGTMRLTLGEPFSTAVEVPATCTTAPGRPDTLVAVTGDGEGVPSIRLANEATGAPLALPGGVDVGYRRHPGPTPQVVIPDLPERAPMYLVEILPDGLEAGPAITFLRAYAYYPVTASVEAWTGRVQIDARRSYAPAFVVNQLLPDDTWPVSYPLTLTWTCDPATTRTLPAPAPRPTGERWVPTPVPTSPPSPPAVVPVEVRLVSSSEWATLRIGGATVASMSDPTIEAGAAATYRDGVFRVEPSARVDRPAGAIFRVSLTGLTPGSVLTLELDHGPSGTAEVTVYNDLGEAPVPVGGYLGSSADRPGWPIEIAARWLLQPVSLPQPATPVPAASPATSAAPG